MCKQKPGTASHRGDRTSGTADVSSSTVDVSSSMADTSPATQTQLTMHTDGTFKVPSEKKGNSPQHAYGPGLAKEEQLLPRKTESKYTVGAMSEAAASNSAISDPWCPPVETDVLPDPYCPRRTKQVMNGKDNISVEDLPCGSEESLLPQYDSSCDEASGTTCPEEVDLIRFSPAIVDENEADRLVTPNHEVMVRNKLCLFSCDKAQFEDDISDGEEFEDAVENFSSEPFPWRSGANAGPDSFGNVLVGAMAMRSQRVDPNLTLEASDLFLDTILPKRLGLPQVRSAAEISIASSTISQKSLPICRICHLPSSDDDALMSPCRCSGTMRFIHSSCLMKWLEISSTRSKRPPSCELCLYQYHRHKKFKVRQWQFPQCSGQDKALHLIFIVSLVVMLGCATATILCFKQDKGIRNSLEKSELTKSEVVTLVCGVFFFVAFFVAMYVEVKSRNTIYKLCMKFIYLNQQWYIDEYDKRKDVQPVPV